MYYKVELTVPANTLEACALESILGMTAGTIVLVQVGFPPGCAGLAHVQIFDKGWQLVPWTPGESVHWDDYVFELPHEYDLLEPPYELKVKAWNLDDVYLHTIWVGVIMREQAQMRAGILPVVVAQGVVESGE
jgi:hypothetical protein